MTQLSNKQDPKVFEEYWYTEYRNQARKIDELCTRTAESLGKIDFEMWRHKRGDTSGLVAAKKLISLRGEKAALDQILIHFHGFLAIEYLIANDTGRENIERNKTRDQRYHLGASI